MKCYSRLSENSQACQVLNKNLPAFLKDPPRNLLDEEGKKCYSNLMKNLNDSLKWDSKSITKQSKIFSQ